MRFWLNFLFSKLVNIRLQNDPLNVQFVSAAISQDVLPQHHQYFHLHCSVFPILGRWSWQQLFIFLRYRILPYIRRYALRTVFSLFKSSSFCWQTRYDFLLLSPVKVLIPTFPCVQLFCGKKRNVAISLQSESFLLIVWKFPLIGSYKEYVTY